MTSRVKADLSRGAIIERALAIADEEGLEAVTIRRIAQEFGVTPMALYWHVPNKDELLAAMGDSFYVGLFEAAAAASGSWDRQLRTIVDCLIDALRVHPASAALAMQRTLACDDGRKLAEHTLDLLRNAGFTVAQAADVARTALQTAIMLVTQQAGEEPQVAAEERDAVLAAKRAALAGLPADRFPRLVEAADALTDCADEKAYFDFGVDLFVSGVRALHRRR
jgi:AcrR family transcriptional regulator